MPYNIQGIVYDDNALGGSPYEQSNTVFIPLKGVVEALGGTVVFDGANATVTLKNVAADLVSSEASVQLTQGFNRTTITLPSDPYGEDVHMFVPLEFFRQAYSILVSYARNTNTVSIG